MSIIVLKKRTIIITAVVLLVAILACTTMFFGDWFSESKSNVNIDKLFKRWESSENWVLISHSTNAGAYEVSGKNIFQERYIRERNGNVFALTRYEEPDDLDGTYASDCTHCRYVYVFKNENGTQHYGRRFYGNSDWVWYPQSGGAFQGTIEDHFYKHIKCDVMFYIKKYVKTIRKDGDIYYFAGKYNSTELLRKMGSKISKDEPDLIMSFMYTLSFGNSEAVEPPESFPTRRTDNLEK